MTSLIKRIFYGLLFALPLMVITYAIAQASNAPQAQPTEVPGCETCHPAFQETWSHGAHGQATDDPAFIKAWQAAGQDETCLVCHVTGYDPIDNSWEADGIACTACHGQITENHPMEPMPADRSGQLCSDCHKETYFQWQASVHSEASMDCSACHDPHGTNLKAEDAATLCASCHQERSSNFMHTSHSEEGLACVDCHMQELTASGIEGHSKRDHSFYVSLDSCNECHVYQMHDDVAVHTDQSQLDVKKLDAMAAVEAMPVTAEPIPVSPVGFIALAGLVGIAFGIVVAPWMERFRRNVSGNTQEEK